MDKAQKREYGYPCTLGVGSGDGQLFVHGTYESIKAAQAIILERDALKADNERMREALNISELEAIKERHTLVWENEETTNDKR